VENSVKTYTAHFNEFADNATTTLQDAAQSRDYFDGAQLTPEEAATLRKRKQPLVVRNMIQRAILKVQGAEAQLRSDPKAYPRTPKDEEGAEAITKGRRYVADNVDFDEDSSEQFEYQIVEGYGGGIVEINKKTLEIEINIPNPDRLYWDIHSRKTDYSDTKYRGIVAWMDVADVKRRWPSKQNEIQDHVDSYSSRESFDDNPGSKRWVNSQRNRMMVNQEYYLDGDVWHEVFFCEACILQKSPSPYLDEDGQPMNPIEIQSSFVSRQGDRYGLVESMKDPQDEVNKRNSKALHILNSNQTIAEKGAVESVNTFKSEKAKPDGHMEVNPGAISGRKIEFVNQTNEMIAHLNMMQEAKGEINDLSIDAELSASASGRSRELSQQDELIKIGRIFDRHRNWKRRMYRQIWARMKQFWDEEKWVRVTDDDDSVEFVGLNIPVTLGQQMEEHAQQTGQQIPQEFLNDPRLNRVVGVKNNVKELDMDIILDDAPNNITLQHETFSKVIDAAAASGEPLPLATVIELMPAMPGKRSILDKLSGNDDPEAQQAQQEAAQAQQAKAEEAYQIEKASKLADIKAVEAKTIRDMTDAEAQALENAAVESGLLDLANG